MSSFIDSQDIIFNQLISSAALMQDCPSCLFSQQQLQEYTRKQYCHLQVEQILEKSTELAQVNAKNRQLYEALISHQAFLESFSDRMAIFDNLKNYKDELEAQKSKNAQLETELEEARRKNDLEREESKGLHSQLHDLQEDLRQLTLDLETERQEKKAVMKEYDHLIQKHEAIKSKMEDMEYDVKSCRDKLSYVSDLKNQLQDLNKFIQDLQEENLILKKRLDKHSIISHGTVQKDAFGNHSVMISESLESPRFFEEPEKSRVSESPKKLHFFSKGLNARVVREGNAGVSPKRFVSTPKNPILRMNTSRAMDSIHSWVEMEAVPSESEAPTFLLDEAEKAKLTLAEFTNYIHDLEIS